MKRGVKPVMLLLPYLAVIVGLYILHNAWLAVALYQVGMLVFLRGRCPIRKVLQGGRWYGIILVFGALAAGVVMWPLWPYVFKPGLDMTVALRGLALSWDTFPWFLLYFFAVTPLLEELYWREAALSVFGRRWFVDVAFAGYHLLVLNLFLKPVFVAVSFVVLLTASIAWREMRRRSGGLAMPAATHVAADVGLLVSFYLWHRLAA